MRLHETSMRECSAYIMANMAPLNTRSIRNRRRGLPPCCDSQARSLCRTAQGGGCSKGHGVLWVPCVVCLQAACLCMQRPWSHSSTHTGPHPYMCRDAPTPAWHASCTLGRWQPCTKAGCTQAPLGTPTPSAGEAAGVSVGATHNPQCRKKPIEQQDLQPAALHPPRWRYDQFEWRKLVVMISSRCRRYHSLWREMSSTTSWGGMASGRCRRASPACAIHKVVGSIHGRAHNLVTLACILSQFGQQCRLVAGAQLPGGHGPQLPA